MVRNCAPENLELTISRFRVQPHRAELRADPLGLPRNDEKERPVGRRKPMPSAYFVVRATVADPAKRAAFDAWYHREHLPDAARAFGVKKAWRFWSVSEPSLHQASYE